MLDEEYLKLRYEFDHSDSVITILFYSKDSWSMIYWHKGHGLHLVFP